VAGEIALINIVTDRCTIGIHWYMGICH
jgi:hypothetical protein